MTDVSDFDFSLMGTPDEAKAKLIAAVRDWRTYCRPRMAEAAEHRRIDRMEAEARFRLANAALLWLWHQENAVSARTGATMKTQPARIYATYVRAPADAFDAGDIRIRQWSQKTFDGGTEYVRADLIASLITAAHEQAGEMT